MEEIIINVVMVTYNHEKYIAQAIESVLNQSTSFSFNLIIGDDCSTDNTFKICRQYANNYSGKILLLRNNINLGLVKNYERVFNVCKGKYISLIEGDDFWIDEKKLQKQTEILELDLEIGLVHASSYMLKEDTGTIVPLSKKQIDSISKHQGFIYDKLIRDNFIIPLTVVFRRQLLEEKINYKFLIDNKIQTIDYALWLGISIHSKVAFMTDIVGVYRILSTSISNTLSIDKQKSFYNSVKQIVNYYMSIHPVTGYSSRDLDCKVNEWLFSKSLTLKNYKYVRFYGRLISIKAVKKVLWSHIKAKIKNILLSQSYNNLKVLI